MIGRNKPHSTLQVTSNQFFHNKDSNFMLDEYHIKDMNEKSDGIKIKKLTNFPEKIITSSDFKN